jgi:TDG/mug DNA glycosylase family protein
VSATTPWRPTREQLAAAHGRRLRDVIAPDLRVLFCGINPSLYSAAVGHHFARPGNRFWKALHASGFTERLLSPFEDATLLERGLGVTNVVARATAGAAELSSDELVRGAARLRRKVKRFRPRVVAVLGVDAYRAGFATPGAQVGVQPERIASAIVWVLPNPSGLNAHWQLPALESAFRELRESS